MPDLFSALAADHERIWELANQLTGGKSAPAGGPRERKAIADRLVQELSRHEVAEETIFWPLVRERLDGGEMAEVALEQEAYGKRVLNELVHVSPGRLEFDTLSHTVAAHLREHMSYEENIVWPKLQLALSREESLALGEKLERAERWAPTRPHPHIPPAPGLLKALSPAAAALDRARNAGCRGLTGCRG